MARNTILVLFTVLAIGIMTVPAYAETQSSPLKQFNMGIPIEQIQCNENKILVQSQNDRPACVYENTAKKLESRGWEIVLQDKINSVESTEMKLDKSNLSDNEISNSTLIVGSTSFVGSESKLGELRSKSKSCDGKLPSSISFETPRRVELGEFFDVKAVISFEGYDEHYWLNNCFDNNLNIRYPPNYHAIGDNLQEGVEFANTGYVPPVISKGVFSENLEYNQPPITFQMKIDEPKDGVYDFGSFGAFTNHDTISVTVYTQISNGYVTFSDEQFITGQSDENKPKRYDPFHLKIWNPKPHPPQPDPSEFLFEWIVEGLEGDFSDHTAAELINRFGLGEQYIKDFLDAYPEYKTQ